MVWQDIYVERRIGDHEIARGIATVFGVPRERVRVLPLEDLATSTQDLATHILCETIAVGGDFQLRITIVLYPPADRLLGAHPERILLPALAAYWDCTLLVDDGEANPYSWRVIHPDGEVVAVTVDADSLDADAPAVVVHERSALQPHPVSAAG